MEFKVKNVWKTYKGLEVIKGFSYEFKSGLYLITGSNGTGKSTILKLFAKLITPTNTNYLIDKIKTTYCAEVFELPSMGSLSYLKMLIKFNKNKMNAKKILDEWGIPNKNILFLSKGNKRKLSLIQTLLCSSDLYLFDEPLDSLDKKAIEKFIESINNLIENSKIVIIVTHDTINFKDYREINLCL